MARRDIWSRLIVCGALTALLLTPAFATEESAKPAEPAEKEKKAASDSTKKPAAEGAKTAKGDDVECKPTATRVNTLEDLFGISNWMRLQARNVKPAAPVTEIAWRDTTADAKPVAKKAKTAKPATQD